MTQSTNAAASTTLSIGSGRGCTRTVGLTTAQVTRTTTGATTSFQTQLHAATTKAAGHVTNAHVTQTSSAPPRSCPEPVRYYHRDYVATATRVTHVTTRTVCHTSGDNRSDVLRDIRAMLEQWLEVLRGMQDQMRTGVRAQHCSRTTTVTQGWSSSIGATHATRPAASPTPTPATGSMATVPTGSLAPAIPAPEGPAWLVYQVRDSQDATKLTGEAVGFSGKFAAGVAGAVDGAKLNEGVHRLSQFLTQVGEYQKLGHELSEDQLRDIAREAEAIYKEAVRTPNNALDAGNYASPDRDGVFDPAAGVTSTRSVVVQAQLAAPASSAQAPTGPATASTPTPTAPAAAA